MQFNSQPFLLVFLPMALAGFAIVGPLGRRGAIGWLAFVSIIFYAQWNSALLVLSGSIITNFLLSRYISAKSESPRIQNILLVIGVTANLVTLSYFKYLFPFLHFLTRAGLSHLKWGDEILPLGISFFTFTQVGYLVDLKQGEAEPLSFESYVFFVTFFPHLIAGPFLHYKEIMPQFAEERRYSLNREDFTVGFTWFTFGLFKKVMIADVIAPFADSVFQAPMQQSVAAAWIGAITYMLELYFDFSGYSDMAIGIARMFSVRLPLNFNSPYKAGSVIEFWSRWHMTLTRYITMYVYSPITLAVNRHRLAAGKKATAKGARTVNGFIEMVAFPVIVTMLLAGIWHGAGLQFVLFGLIFGISITIEHMWNIFRRSKHPSSNRVIQMLSVLRVNAIVMVAFVFFRSASASSAMELLHSMTGLNPGASSAINPTMLMPLLLLPVVWFLPNTQQILGEPGKGETGFMSRLNLQWKPSVAWAVAIGIGFFLALINMSNGSRFLYFQF